jgi:Spy/CpxP family protein refolding chaperone
MKRNIIVCALLATMAAGGTGVWAGSGNGFEPPVNDKPCHCSEPEYRMPPPPSPEGLIDHITRQLKLTSEQQTKIRALFAKDEEKAEPLRQKLAEYRKQLQAAMNSATFDETAIRAIAARQAQTEVDLTLSKARLHSQINALLTPEQRSLAKKFSPPFPHKHGAQLVCGDDRGPRPRCNNKESQDHMPPPPCGDHRVHQPDSDCDSE